MFRVWEVNGKEYKLRITTGEGKALERKLGGKNPADILMAMERGKLPTMTETHLILHAAMQKFHHSTAMKDVEDIYDQYLDDGKSLTDLIPLITEVLQDAGFLPRTTDEEAENESNETLIE